MKMTPSSPTRLAQEPGLKSFALDVRQGLSSRPKRLSSKYFYDEAGDKLFQAIMRLPEYYLTNCELEIFESQKQAILDAIDPRTPFDLIELGAGDGFKTKILLRHFLERGADFRYRPVDISPFVLRDLEEELRADLPDLSVEALPGDYFEMLEKANRNTGRKKVIFFLGSTIGNLEPEEARRFLCRIASHMNSGDLLLLGFDLKKDPQLILDAYNDASGVTAAFNLNLLHRINRELGGDFDPAAFRHWETYNPLSGATRSYLVSLRDQRVRIDGLNMVVTFEAWEAIEVELSQKYSLPQIENLSRETGFSSFRHFFDKRRFFVDSLWGK